MSTTHMFTVTGMHCASCGIRVDDALEDLPGVRRSTTSVRAGRTVVEHDGLDPQDLAAAINAAGYGAELACCGRSEPDVRQRRARGAGSGRSAAIVTVTRRSTAASDGRSDAAPSACLGDHRRDPGAVYTAPTVALLVLGGLLIALTGAVPPATWAARIRTTMALRTE